MDYAIGCLALLVWALALVVSRRVGSFVLGLCRLFAVASDGPSRDDSGRFSSGGDPDALRDDALGSPASVPVQGSFPGLGIRPEHSQPDGGTGLRVTRPAGWPDYGRARRPLT